MSRRVRPFCMVRLREPSPLFSSDHRWKVTSRYELRLTAKTSVKCVRVSPLNGGAAVHVSETEFHRLFVTEEELEERARRRKRRAV